MIAFVVRSSLKASLWCWGVTTLMSQRSANGSVWKLVSMCFRSFLACGFLVFFVLSRR